MHIKDKHFLALYYGIDENLPDKVFTQKINEINASIEQSIQKMKNSSKFSENGLGANNQ